MPVLRLFASAREAAGVARAEFPGATVAEMLEGARAAYGERFSAVLARSRIWVNGEPASVDTVVRGHDVVAVLPPVSGGAGAAAGAVAERTTRPPGARSAGDERPRGRESPPRERRPGGAGGGPPAKPPAPSARSAEGPAPGGEQIVGAMGGLGGERRPVSNGARTGDPGQAQAAPAAGRLVTLADGDERSRPVSPPPVTTTPSSSSSEAPARDAALGMAHLAVTYGTTRPHGRIGVLWAIATVAVTIQGQAWLAGWLSLIAFVGASQATGARRTGGHRPPPVLAAVLAAAAPIAAVYGVRYLVAVVGGGLALAVVTGALGHGRGTRDLALAIGIGVVMGAAAAGPVVTRDLGIAPTLFLFACMATYDAGAYLVGTGASSAWEGPVAGMVALIPVTLIGAIILSPPFPSGTPLGLGALAACLAPLGPLVGTALVGSRDVDAPGLRRLDSLILLGPVFAWFSTSLLR